MWGWEHCITQAHTITHNFLTCVISYLFILYECNAHFVVIKDSMLPRV